MINIFSYKPLLIELAKKGMSKTDLRLAAGLSTATLAKISKGEYVSMETLDSICKCLNCEIENVIQYIPSIGE